MIVIVWAECSHATAEESKKDQDINIPIFLMASAGFWRTEVRIPLNQKKRQSDQSRQRLNIKDSFANRKRAEDASNRHTTQKEYLHGVACENSPDQTCCEEAVVQPLIGCQCFGLCRKLGSGAEGFSTRGLLPQKHFKDEKIPVQKCNDSCNHIYNDIHFLLLVLKVFADHDDTLQK